MTNMGVKNETILWINYGPIYYISLFFGIMPFKYLWNTAENGMLNYSIDKDT